MSKPLVVLIPHQLGREGAKRRLQDGVGDLKNKFGDKVTSIEESWQGDRLDVSVRALGQSASVQLDVMDEQVRVEVQLPWMLAAIANKAKTFLQREGQLMLEKKK